ncbi:polysaccharide deacetylase family protein [Pedobacter aquatilis]|uniref:polysaccharide deacetylase family protein n=1 Tax=Pedobacter aquatilis TaxID=351343 RepID=UPI0029313D21|nr:polysaccharide deacetylase family protein [Pedobacter aquatilis]
MMKKLLLGLLAFLSLSGFAQNKTVVLTFDDSPSSHYSFVAPLLKQYGFGATFYVCEFPGIYPDTSLSLSWGQVKAISKMGFEIGNHTWHHTGVKGITEAKLNAELAYVEAKCDSLGIPKMTSFCYPGYTTDSLATIVLKKRGYLNGRTGGERAYVKGKDDPFYIPSYTISDGNKNTFYDALKQPKDSEIVVFCFHGVPDRPHPWVSVNETDFKAYMDYLKANNYRVIAMKDLKIK